MRKYGASPVVAVMRDTYGLEYDIIQGPYTIDVWQVLDSRYGGSRLYGMYADMSVAEVIALLAEDFGMVEYCEGEVVE